MLALNFRVCPHALLGNRLADWVVFTARFRQMSGVHLRLVPFWAFPAFRAAREATQVAYVDTAEALVLMQAYDFTPVAVSQAVDEALIVTSDHGAVGLEALAGKRAATVFATATTCAAVETLARRGIRPLWLSEAGWLQVVRAVGEGRASFGVLPSEVFFGLSRLARQDLRVIGRPLFSTVGHFFVVKRDYPQAVQRIQETLLAMGETPDERILLTSLGIIGWTRPEEALPRASALLEKCTRQEATVMR